MCPSFSKIIHQTTLILQKSIELIVAKKEVKQKGIEETLWKSANKLRGSVEPSEYKHVVLGLIFPKFASDKFEEHRKLMIDKGQENTLICPISTTWPMYFI